MREITLHLLDLAENSVSAGARTVQIAVCEDLEADLLTASIQDNGRGMDEETVKRVTDPFYTSRTTRKVGLGIPLFKEAAEACNGGLTISSKVGEGTQVSVSFQHSHIDRMPLGNLSSTFLGLLIGHPDMHWLFRYTARNNGTTDTFEFDDQPVKDTLEGLPLTHPEVLSFVRGMIEEGIAETKKVLN